MTYQQSSRIAIIKRVTGWLIFFPALLSTCISMLNFMFTNSQRVETGINAVILDFVYVMTDMVRYHTPFLSFFWHHSPVPDFYGNGNLIFWIIYILIFVGLALQASGARMWEQSKRVKKEFEDLLIIEQIKGNEGRSRQEMEEKIILPRNSIFFQIFPLYLLPAILLIAGYLLFSSLGML